jgi:hypothetical protein
MLVAHVNCKMVNFWVASKRKEKNSSIFLVLFFTIKIYTKKKKLGKFNNPRQTHIWVVPLKLSHLDFTRPIQLKKIIGNI